MEVTSVIQSFMAKLANHGYAYSDAVGTNMLDSAVRASSRFSNIQAVIDAMTADQVAAEKQAVAEILGNSYADKTLSQVSSSILTAKAQNNSAVTLNSTTVLNSNTTVEDYILERKAEIFLEAYCGIQLNKKFGFYTSGGKRTVAIFSNQTVDNTDTGAITGSDADANNSTKTDRSVVPEQLINTYIASTTKAQNISTNDRDWVVQATSSDDTITSNGADSVNAGAGSDQITANADGATITSGNGADFITVSQTVSDVTLSDLNSNDTLTISGTFEIGSAHIEDTLLVITDKTGKRKIRLGDFDNNARNAKVNSTTIGDWLSNAGININNLTTKNYSEGKVSSNASNIEIDTSGNADEDSGRIAIDPDYTPSPIPAEEKPSVEKVTDDSLGTPHRSANTTGVISVDLANVDTSAEGDVVVDGATVGTVSSTFPNASTFTRNGLTIHLLGTTSDTTGNPNNITAKTFDQLTDAQKAIVAGLFKWWGKDCLTLNEESYGISFNSPTAMVKDIGLFFYDSGSSGNTLASVWNWQRNSTDGAATKLMLNVNMNYYSNVSASDMDGTTSASGAGLLDRTLAHEFTHAVMAANVNFFNALPKFVKEGLAELTHGIDDERGGTIFEIAYDATELASSLVLDDTGTGSQDVGDAYAGGYMFFRYFAKQAAAQSLPAFGEITATVNLSNNNADYYISGNSISETASTAAQGNIKIGSVSDGVYTVINTGVHQIINNTANLKIVGLTVNDTLIGGAGADTVQTAEGSSIQTGAGNDSILLSGQYATIDTGDDNDTVSVADGSHHSINLGEGNDSVLFGGNANTIIGGDGNDTINQYSNSTGGNYFVYNSTFGDDTILGFNSNDSILIPDTFTYSQSGSTITISKDDTVKGRIYLNGVSTPNVISGVVKELIKEDKTMATTIAINSGSSAEYFNKGSVESAAVYVIDQNASASSVFIGSGKGDTITNNRFSMTIQGGASNDSIINSAAGVSISGGSGADTITTTNQATIYGGVDDDSVSIGNGVAATYQYKAGDGSDTIKGFNNNILQIMEDATTIKTATLNGSTVIFGFSTATDKITFDSGDINTIKGNIKKSNGTDNYSLSGISIYLTGNSASNNTYTNNIEGATIAGNSTVSNNITNNSKAVKITGSSQVDTIINNAGGSGVTIETGEGNDTITNNATNVTISAGSGNDKITNTALSGVLFNYGGGNDNIEGFNGNELSIASGALSAATLNTAGSLVLSLGSGSKITLGSYSLADNKTLKLATTNITIGSESATLSNFINQMASITINGSASAETITNKASGVSINAGDGDDSITNESKGTQVTITAGGGSDIITNSAATVSIDAGEGNDIITNSAATVSIDAGEGNDTITNNATNVTISAGAGDDSINNAVESGVLFNYGGGSDTISGFKGNTLKISTGTFSAATLDVDKNLILNVGGSSTISLGDFSLTSKVFSLSSTAIQTVSGNLNLNVFNNSASGITISGTDAAETITNSATGVSINAGGGSNVITNEATTGTNVTITTGEDNDTIDNKATGVQIFAGGGSDSIINSGSTVTIDSGAGADYVSNSGASVLFIYNGGNDTIVGFGTSSTLKLGTTASITSATLKADDIVLQIGEDQVSLAGASSLVIGDNKNIQSLNLYNKDNTKITLGTVVIDSTLTGKTISGTDANETIENYSESVTIAAGAGNDVIKNTIASSVTFSYGGGNDSIENFKGNTLTIAENAFKSASLDAGKNLILNVGGSSTISLGLFSLAANNTFTLTSDYIKANNTSVNMNVFSNSASGITISGTSAAETINNFAANVSIGGGSGTDFINNSASGTSVTITTGDANDTIINKANLVTINSGSGADSISNSGASVVFEYLDNTTGKTTISGFNATSTLKTGSSTTTVSSVTLNADSVVLKMGSDNNNEIHLAELSAIPTGQISNGTSTVGLNNIFVADGAKGTIVGTSGDDTITNSASGVTISMGGGSDSIKNNDGVTGVTFIYGGGSDTIEGFGTNALKVGTSATIGKATLDTAGNLDLTIGNDVIQLKGLVTSEFKLDSLSLYNNDANTTSALNDFTNNKESVTITGTASADTINNSASGVSINAGGGSNVITNEATTGTNVTITTGEDNDTIDNKATGVQIFAGGGSDSIINSGSTVTIDSGAGADYVSNSGASVVFIYNGGADTIDGFQADSKLSLGSGFTFSKATVGAQDVTLSISGSNGGTILLKGASSIFNAGMSVFNASGSVVTLNNFEIADGATGTINGTASNDTVTNKSKNVTISLGAGDDSVNNESGSSVTFIHGGGNDIIGGFSSSTLRIGSDSTVSAASLNGNDITLKIGDDTVKLQSVTLGGTSFSLTSPFNLYKGTGTSITALTNIQIDSLPSDIKLIIGGESAETITNNVGSITINAGGGSNFITNNTGGASVSIASGSGADTISNTANYVTIASGSGVDSISNSGTGVTFQYTLGDGATKIKGFKDNSKLQLMSDNASISKATLNSDNTILQIGGTATNTITLEEYPATKNFPISVLNNGGSAVTLKNIEIALGTINTIANSIEGATITGTGSADTISNTANKVSIFGGLDVDSIVSSGNSVTIDAGQGNDNISIGGASVLLLYNTTLNGGKDVITGFNATSTLQLSGYTNTTIAGSKITAGREDLVLTMDNNGTNAITLKGVFQTLGYSSALNIVNKDNSVVTFSGINITGTERTDSIDNYFANATINALSDKDTITNYGVSGVSINAGAGADIIYNKGENATSVTIVGSDANSIKNEGASAFISLGGGKDTVYNVSGASFVSIVSGEGDDYISNTGASASIVAGAGKDNIYSTGDKVTIDAGAGDDLISISGASSYVDAGAGADIIYNKGENATSVTIVGSDANSIKNEGASAFISLGGGKDTVYNVSGASFVSIVSGEGDDYISNTGASASIIAGAGNDIIRSTGDYVTIDGGAGDDNISIGGSSALFIYSGGKDTITGFANDAKIQLAGGYSNTSTIAGSLITANAKDLQISLGANDILTIKDAFPKMSYDTLNIVNSSTPAATINFGGIKINGTANADTIVNYFANATINASAGADVITNNGASAYIDAGDGNDTVSSSLKADVTILGGAGNDSIINSGASATGVSILGGAGNDYISNSLGSGASIFGDVGNDTILNLGASASLAYIYGGDANDSIRNEGASSYINLGKGDDSVYNDIYTAKSVSIVGEAGSNYVSNNGGASIYISLGSGDDKIFNSGASAIYATIYGGDGVNTVSNAGESAIISLGSGNDSIINLDTAKGVSIFAGDGANKINNAGESAVISLGAGADLVTNSGAAASIVASDGKDSITNSGASATIYGGAGDDSIVNSGASATIYGDAGKDYIKNDHASFVAIYGGKDNDTIVNTGGASATIYGGEGDDSIVNEANAENVVFAYSLGGGKDTITGFNTSSTFSVMGGNSEAKYEYSSTVDSNNNVILNIYGDSLTSTVTFIDAGKLSTFGLSGNISLSNVLRLDDNAPSSFDVTTHKLGGVSAGEQIKVIDASARKKAISIIGNEKANSIVGGTGNDTLNGGGSAAVVDSLTGGNGKDVFIFSGGSVIIEDYAVGADKVSLASSIAGAYTKFESIGNDLKLTYTTGTGNNTVTHNLTIIGGYDKAITFNDGDTTDVVRAYKDNGVFNSSVAKATAMTLESDATLLNATQYGAVVTINAESVNSAIAINGNTLGNYIIAGSLSGATINGGGGNDTIVAGGQSDTAKPYVFVYENTSAGTDVIKDYNSANMSISLGSGIKEITDATVSESVATFKFGNNSAIVTNFAANTANSIVSFTGGVSATFSLTSADQGVFVNSATSATAISLPATFANAYTVPGGVHTVDASDVSKAIYILGSESATSIRGSKNNDTLAGVSGNNTLTGGEGVDLFVYSGGGSDTITDYATTDRISVKGVTYSGYSFGGGSSKNLILSYKTSGESATDAGTLTLLDARTGSTANSTVTFAEGTKTTTYIYNSDAVFDAKQTAATIFGGASSFNASPYNALVTIDGTEVTNEASIFGNDRANIITAGPSGATIDGGKGNDTLRGGGGSDTFVYVSGGGTDVIENYGGESSTDVISLGSGLSIRDVTTKNGETTFKIGTGAVVVKNPSVDKITFIGAVSGTYSLTSDTQGVFVAPADNPTAISLPASFTGPYTVPGGISTVNASQVAKAIYITGNDEANSILGSDGNDTLSGGASGNDTLTGGKGNDLFIFGGGSDVITDYAAGDKININDDLNYKDYSISNDGKDLVLTYTDDEEEPTTSTLSIVGAAATTNNTITFAEGNKTTVNVFTDRGIFDVKKTMVTINSGLSSFYASVDSGLATIDGTAITKAASIFGNGNNNYIIAGDSGTTLYGGKGNDLFTLGGGSDVVFYDKNSVNYTIVDYDNTDDHIYLDGVPITDAVVNTRNDDVTFKVGKNSIVVKGVADSLVTFKQAGGDDSVFSDGVFSIASTSSVIIPTSYSEGSYSLAGGLSHVDASARTKPITLEGNAAANSLIGGDGNDVLNGFAGADSLLGGKGNDVFVYTGGEDVIVDYSPKGTNGADKISLGGSVAESNYSDFRLDGKDLVIGYDASNSLTIKEGDGKEIAFANGKTYIYDKDGVFDTKRTTVTLASSLTSYNASAEIALLTISASAVKDTIAITGNSKNNVIIAGSTSATMNGKEGNDTLVGGAGNDVFFYENSSAGNDLISLYSGESSSDVISLGSGLEIDDVTFNKNNRDVVIKLDKNVLTVKDMAASVGSTIQFAGADSRTFSIVSGTLGVFVDENAKSVSLPATFANAYTVNGGMSHVDASALTKLITLTGDANANSLIGGAGNDVLNGLTGNDTLKGGAGNDVFVFGGGQDVIVDYNEAGADKISITSGLTETGFSISGDDLIIHYGTGTDSLTIKNGKKNDTISFANGKTTDIKVYDSVGTFDTKRVSVTLAPTTTFNASSESKYSNLITINGSEAGSATITGNDTNNYIVAGGNSATDPAAGSTLNGGKGNDTLVGTSLGADVFIYEKNTGNDTIVDYGTGDKISLGSDLEIADVTTKTDRTKAEDITFKIGKNSVVVKGIYDSVVPNISLTAGAGHDSVYNVKSGTFMETNETGVSVTLPANYNTKQPYTLGAFDDSHTITSANASSLKKAINFVGNNLGNTLIGGKGNDMLKGGTGNDYFVGNEGGDTFIYEGGADSIEAYEVKDKINTTLGYTGYSIVNETVGNSTINNVVLNYGDSNTLSIKGGMDQAISFLSGNNKKAEIKYFNDKGVFDSKKTAFSLQTAGNSDATTSFALPTGTDFAKLITINGGDVTNKVSIVGGTVKANYIVAGASGATLNGGGKQNDTLVGGTGADVFIYESSVSGNDIIKDYGADDKISLGSGLEIADVTKKNDDVVFKIGKSSLTIKDGVKNAKNITLTGGNISDSVIYDITSEILISNDNTAVSIPASYSKNNPNSFTLSDSMAKVNASARTKPIKLTGSDNVNTIIGGKGNDTLEGKAGADSLFGGDGNDVFIFSGGNDTIADYTAKDKINDSAVAGSYSDFSISGSNVILGYGDSSLTIANSKDSLISFANGKKTEVRIYGDKGVSDGKITAMTLASGLTEAFTASSNLVTIDGSNVTASATITGNTKGNHIYSGANSSSTYTLNGKAGNDTLYGGEGKEVFVYESGSGNDVISGFGEGDKVSLVGSSSKITDVSIKEDNKTKTKDLIVKVEKNTITIKNGAMMEEGITFTGTMSGTLRSNGAFVTEDTMTLFPSFTGTVSGDGMATVDASLVKAGLNIEGGDYIIGGNGKDTLSGGTTLWGGKGNDSLIADSATTIIFHAGEGTDTITGYTNQLLSILAKDSNSKAGIKSGKLNKDNNLNIAVDGGGAIIIPGFDAENGTVNINGDTYAFSGEGKARTFKKT